MGVYKAPPTSFAKIHRNYLTPSVSTITMGAVSILFYVLFTMVSPNLLSALDRFGRPDDRLLLRPDRLRLRVVLPQGPNQERARDFMMRGVVPPLGGLILLVVFAYGLIQYAKPDWLTDDDGNNVTIFGFGAVAVVGIGALVLGRGP